MAALVAASRRIPDRPAVIDGDRHISYGEYARAVAAYARLLADRGVAGGQVALLMHNSMEMAVAALAGMTAGAQVAPLDYNQPHRSLEKLTADVDPRIIVSDAANAELARSVATDLGVPHVDVFAPDALLVEAWLGGGHPSWPERLPSAEDPSLLFFTGGTTGIPKAASHTYANDVAYARATATMWRFDQDSERLLNVAPNFHVWGFCKMVVTPPFNGATIDILPRYKPELVLQRIESQRITVFAGGPAAMYVGLRAHEHYPRTDFTHLKWALAGGSPCPEELLRNWEDETGTPILEGWGMTEGAPCNVNPADGVRKIGSTGITPPRTEVDVVDLETGTRVLPPGERGEVRVRGPQFVAGYRNRPDETAATFRDGWLYSGDIGYFDDDGYMFLVDRRKEMIVVGGYNVFPREIDEVLNAHPAILEAAAVGIPDDFRGEAVKVCVALERGATLGPDELRTYLAERLVKYKLPREIAFFDELPKTGPGKIDKLRLRGLR